MKGVFHRVVWVKRKNEKVPRIMIEGKWLNKIFEGKEYFVAVIENNYLKIVPVDIKQVIKENEKND